MIASELLTLTETIPFMTRARYSFQITVQIVSKLVRFLMRRRMNILFPPCYCGNIPAARSTILF